MYKKRKWFSDFYQEGSEKEIVRLMQSDIRLRGSQAVFNLPFWYWKYKNNNVGFNPKWILLARSHEDKSIVGHYTAIPIKIKAYKKIVLAAQSVDTITHVNFRKQGIFSALAQLCYKEIHRDNVDIIFGYPNDKSYPGFVSKLNWQHIFTVKELGYVLNDEKIAQLKFSNAFKVAILKYFIKSYKTIKGLKYANTKNKLNFMTIDIKDIPTGLINNWLDQNYSYYIERSRDYFAWRYIANPIDKNFIIRACYEDEKFRGFYILKFKDYPHRNNITVAHIMELFFDPGKKGLFNSMFKDIKYYSQKNSADIIHTYTHNKQHDYKKYKGAGFLKFDNKNYIIRIKNKELYPNIEEQYNWYISLGDSDRA
jgi:hypothetical protein